MRKYYLGIDPGVKTGLALWDTSKKNFEYVTTCDFWAAHGLATDLFDLYGVATTVIIEDPRKVRFRTDPAKAQGAGSVKRDATLWEELCKRYSIAYQLLRPNKAITKWDAKKFKQFTGWEGRTSSHARDAAMLVFDR